MAKALYGHLGADARLMDELVRLRVRVRELQAEVLELQALLRHEADLRADLDRLSHDPA